VKTQARINEHVERYGYTLNHSARSLKLNKTETLGLIVPNISNVFFATLAEKLELRCRRSGYQLMISCTYNDVDYENKLVRALIARNVDGLFIVPSTLENQQHHLRQIQKPLVLLDRDFGFTRNALVESHNEAGGDELARSMLEVCDTPLWFLVGDTALPSITDRLFGTTEFVDQLQLGVTRGHNQLACGVNNRLRIAELDATFVFHLDAGFSSRTRCRTTDVERTHRQLCTRLTDGLCRDNADCFTA
jgi:DNA-binding LacI/PurR family transcriptional regulator